MLKAGLSNTSLMPLVNVAFMLVFFGCRNVWGPSECCALRMGLLLLALCAKPLVLSAGWAFHPSSVPDCALPRALLLVPRPPTPCRCSAVMTVRFWRDAASQLASANPALPHTAIHIIR